MRSRLFAVSVMAALASAQTWESAVSGYRYQFPRDYFSHCDYQTEWWYYTGNLHDSKGRRYGFELTFFRQGVHLAKDVAASEAPAWRPDQVYLAHLAFSDLDGGEFYHTERLNRAGPGLAGATDGSPGQRQRYWNGNWQVSWNPAGKDEQELEAVSDRLKVRLKLQPEKPLVINGKSGVSVKGPLPGEASHYLTFTRLRATGEVQWKGESHTVDGLAWMDHEFFTEPQDNTLAGWDWFAIQLDSNEELMLYQLRNKSGQASGYSSGTYVDATGAAHFLSAAQFTLSRLDYWRSTATHANYPVGWKITVPSLELELTEQTSLKNQELFSQNGVTGSYWEGAVTYAGHLRGQPAKGVGYLEMTGYERAVDLAGKQNSSLKLGH